MKTRYKWCYRFQFQATEPAAGEQAGNRMKFTPHTNFLFKKFKKEQFIKKSDSEMLW
jgi:hypothetical protein